MPGPGQSVDNILTIDLEEWFHLDEEVLPVGEWAGLASRVETSTRVLLDLLDRRRARATFFALGWVAARHPALLAEIGRRGHEVATHGYQHRSAWALSESEFVTDLRRAREAIESASGAPVLGYRAARWSLGGRPGRGRRGAAAGIVTGALDALIREGIRYDSSLAPIVHIGDPSWPVDPYRIDRPGGSIVELPPLVGRLLGVRLLFAGGWALRRVPNRLIRRAIARCHARGAPAVLDLHAWEFDPAPPRVPLPLRYRLAHYAGLRGVVRKIDDLLEGTRSGGSRWVPVRDYLDSSAAAAPKRDARSARSIPSIDPSESRSEAGR